MPFDPISAGISLGLGAISSIGQYQQDQNRARIQNQAAMDDYKQRLRIRAAEIVQRDGEYNLDTFAYKKKLINLGESAQAAYQTEQLRMNELFKQARFARQAENIELAKATGRQAARGVSGKTAARMQAMDVAAYGRNQAIRAQSLFSAETGSELRKQRIQRDLTANREAAYAKVAFAPNRPFMPMEPTQLEGPSQMSLFTNLLGVAGNAAMSGIEGGRANEALKQRKPL